MSMFLKMVEKDPTKYPARMGKKWDDDEVLKLLKSIQKKKTISFHVLGITHWESAQ